MFDVVLCVCVCGLVGCFFWLFFGSQMLRGKRTRPPVERRADGGGGGVGVVVVVVGNCTFDRLCDSLVAFQTLEK